jgi:hypothetical protein
VRARALDALALAAELALAASLRASKLALLHDRGDQLIWAAVARNVSARGASGYTIRGIDTLYVGPPGSDLALVRAELAPLESGSLVAGLVASGESYWDAPLANQPPGFVAVLLGSHSLLGTTDDGFPLLGRAPPFQARRGGPDAEEALARATAEKAPPGVVRAQLWATLPPLVSDLATVALLFVAGVRLLGSRSAALVASLAWACDPLAIFAAHRVLSNSTLAAASLATLVACCEAERREGRARTAWLAVAGLLAAFAIAIKASAVLLLPAAVVGWVLQKRKPDAGALVFLALPVLVNAPWWALQAKVLGNPLGFAWTKTSHWPEGSAWGALVTSRGAFYYPMVLLHSPLALAPFALVFQRGSATPGARAVRVFALAFGGVVLGAALFFSGGKEARHVLLAFPALLLAAASWVESSRARLVAIYRRPVFADTLIAGSLGALFYWEASRGLAFAFATAAIPP